MEQAVKAGSQDHAVSPATEAATAWQRYWARNLDLTISTHVVSLAANLLFPSVTRTLFGKGVFAPMLETIILFPFAFVIDAVILGLWGKTLGSLLCGIRVVTAGRGPIGLALALRRNLLIYVYGVGCGLPLISLVACIHNHNKVEQNTPTSWDAACGTRVDNVEGSPVRTWTTFGLIFAAGLAQSIGMMP